MWMSHQITSSFWLLILKGTVWRWKAIINLSNKTWLNELRIDTFNHNHILLAIYFACTKTSFKHQLLLLHVFSADHYDKRYNLKLGRFHFWNIFPHVWQLIYFEEKCFVRKHKKVIFVSEIELTNSFNMHRGKN